jgi:hypothetical protein
MMNLDGERVRSKQHMRRFAGDCFFTYWAARKRERRINYWSRWQTGKGKEGEWWRTEGAVKEEHAEVGEFLQLKLLEEIFEHRFSELWAKRSTELVGVRGENED